MKKFSEYKKINEQEITLNPDVVKVEVQSSSIQTSPNTETQIDNNAGNTQSSVMSNNESENKENSENIDKGSPSKFFSKLFESSEMARVYHLTVKGDTGSHAAHIALASYYESIVEITDELIEVYQGQYDIISEYDVINTTPAKDKDKVEYFKDVVNFIKSNRNCISVEDTHIHNLIDEAIAVMYRTIYKLKFNK